MLHILGKRLKLQDVFDRFRFIIEYIIVGDVVDVGRAVY